MILIKVEIDIELKNFHINIEEGGRMNLRHKSLKEKSNKEYQF